MNDDWKNDPRLKDMNPEKIRFLSDFADRLNNTPGDQLLSCFLSVTAEAAGRNMTFSDEETGLLTDILIQYMSPEDRGRLDMLRMLSKKMASGRG